MHRTILVGLLFASCIFPSTSSGQSAKDSGLTLRDQYHVIEVASFVIQTGVDFPPEYLAGVPQEVANKLKDSKRFGQVLLPGETPSPADAPALRLVGMITDFDRGSRGKRYLGFGMGAARVFVTVQYLDRSSGLVLFEDHVVGTLSGGVFGGDTKGVVQELANSIAGTTKLMLLRSVSAPSNARPSSSRATGQAPADLQVVQIKGNDLTGAQQRINEVAASGYRLVDFRITGDNRAQVTMDKTAVPPQTYQYLLLHAISERNVQKNLTKGAGEGYRLCPHTLATLAGFAVMMEKPPAPADTRYEYRFHASLRESSAEKNILEDQKQGFLLVESGSVTGHHVVITEKPVTVQETEKR
jgi:hypothetical protein